MSRASVRWEHTEKAIEKMHAETVKQWCMALHGVHDEHQCHLKPGHPPAEGYVETGGFHECYCGVRW